jgi:hypothetical protein
VLSSGGMDLSGKRNGNGSVAIGLITRILPASVGRRSPASHVILTGEFRSSLQS